jgi:hypothetical protein
MIIREYRDSDLKALRSIHEKSQFNYELLAPNHKDIVVKRVLDQDGPRAAVFLRRTHEAYLLIDKDWATPFARLSALRAMHNDVHGHAHEAGITEVFFWMPPEIEKSFARRLGKWGWKKQLWHSYSNDVRDYA